MIRVIFDGKPDRALKILCLGSHCDDIEIGCGGTLLSWLRKYERTEVQWVVFSSDSQRKKEAKRSADSFLMNSGRKIVEIKNYRNGYFPYYGGKIKEYFETLKVGYSPDLIFTHYRMDLHQDHRTISELTWNTFRNHLILEYEVPKYDGDLSSPNLYVPLDENICMEKIDIITRTFHTQDDKHWFTEDLFWSSMRLRGMESRSATNFAEGFYCRKICM